MDLGFSRSLCVDILKVLKIRGFSLDSSLVSPTPLVVRLCLRPWSFASALPHIGPWPWSHALGTRIAVRRSYIDQGPSRTQSCVGSYRVIMTTTRGPRLDTKRAFGPCLCLGKRSSPWTPKDHTIESCDLSIVCALSRSCIDHGPKPTQAPRCPVGKSCLYAYLNPVP